MYSRNLEKWDWQLTTKAWNNFLRNFLRHTRNRVLCYAAACRLCCSREFQHMIFYCCKIDRSKSFDQNETSSTSICRLDLCHPLVRNNKVIQSHIRLVMTHKLTFVSKMPTMSMLPAFRAVFPASFRSVRLIVPESTGLFGIRGGGINRTDFRGKLKVQVSCVRWDV